MSDVYLSPLSGREILDYVKPEPLANKEIGTVVADEVVGKVLQCCQCKHVKLRAEFGPGRGFLCKTCRCFNDRANDKKKERQRKYHQNNKDKNNDTRRKRMARRTPKEIEATAKYHREYRSKHQVELAAKALIHYHRHAKPAHTE
jgi:hypothetical protein